MLVEVRILKHEMRSLSTNLASKPAQTTLQMHIRIQVFPQGLFLAKTGPSQNHDIFFRNFNQKFSKMLSKRVKTLSSKHEAKPPSLKPNTSQSLSLKHKSQTTKFKSHKETQTLLVLVRGGFGLLIASKP